jgi:hydroxymethylbilane synthase
VRGTLGEAGIGAELVLIRTSGDRERETPLRALGGKGIFIKELEDALLEDRVDLAVHSMKDVPTELPSGLLIAAVCEREDVRDALVSRERLPLEALPRCARLGTGSLRRQAQLRARRPDLEMGEIRGNVDTRLAKLDRGEFDAIVLAKAGLQRLGLAERITELLSTDICLPAAGQGAIGIEVRGRDESVLSAVRQLDHAETHAAVEAERAVLAALEGGCQVPIGVWARMEAAKFVVDACVVAADGSDSLRAQRAGSPGDSLALARQVAEELLGRGAERLLRVAGRSLGGG